MSEKTEEKQDTTIQGEPNKKMHGEAMDDPVYGALSFAELDEMETAVTEQSALTKLVAKFQALARNVMGNTGLMPQDKVSALRQLSDDMRNRLDDVGMQRGERSISLPTIDGKLDRTYLEKLIKDETETKQEMTKTEGGEQYRASDYADVPDMEKPSTWKLRLAEGGTGKFTVAQVARAITAMQPSGFRGQRVVLGQPRATVVKKIDSVIGGLDATDQQKENLRSRLNAVKSLRTGFEVVKAIDGSYRWLGWVSNKFMDREGEILTEKAHLDYIAWLDQNPQAAPELWTYHIPGTAREKRTDFWGYVNGFLVLGGPLTEKEAKVFESVDIDFAMSHGFYVLSKDKNLIEQYRTFEATVLPREAAANLWTEFNVKELLNMALTDKQRELAEQLHGTDFVAALESDTKERAKLLQEAGVQNKQADDTDEVEEVSNTGELDMKAFANGIVEEVVKQLNPTGLQEALKSVHDLTQQNVTAIENITKRLEALEISDDAKLAKELTPKVGFDWQSGFLASKSDKTVLKDNNESDQKLKEAQPRNNWASQLFNFGEEA